MQNYIIGGKYCQRHYSYISKRGIKQYTTKNGVKMGIPRAKEYIPMLPRDFIACAFNFSLPHEGIGFAELKVREAAWGEDAVFDYQLEDSEGCPLSEETRIAY